MVAVDGEGRLRRVKVLSTPREPWRGFLAALEALGEPLERVEAIVHASTLGTNMFLGQVGLEPPELVLVTNLGFRDVLEIGRQNRPELYNPRFQRPRPLVPRSRRVGVGGRLWRGGVELEPLDAAAVEEAARRFCGPRTVFVVSLLHSYANPSHELEAERIIRRVCPGARVVLGSRVDPQPGEYERTSTAVVNAALAPLVAGYLERLRGELGRRGFRGRLLLMQSSGGLASPETIEAKPALFVESGPAAGVVAAAYMARLLGVERLLAFDMGGTTAKAAAVVGGEPGVVYEYELGGRVHMGRLVRGSGYPVRAPFIDLAEVSSGGGSIAWIDPGGALRVGPLSAGADPGPACYGRGGREPTVTDAHAVLGHLPPTLAGGLRLRLDLAREAVSRIARALGLEVEEAAEAILGIADENMARALRLVTVERGHDPRGFTLLAYGGMGPLHAASLAERLGVERIAVPPAPGVFSALGLLLADHRHDLARGVEKKVEELPQDTLDGLFEEMREEADRLLDLDGAPREGRVYTRLLEMRYQGQRLSLRIPYTGNLGEAVESFESLYQARYGYTLPEPPLVSAARLTAAAPAPKPRLPEGREEPHTPRPAERREAHLPGTGWTRVAVYRRESLRPGAALETPAIVYDEDSTILIPEGYTARVDRHHVIWIERS